MITDLNACHSYTRREAALRLLEQIFPASVENHLGKGIVAVNDAGRFVAVVVTSNPELLSYCLHSKAVGGKVCIIN